MHWTVTGTSTLNITCGLNCDPEVSCPSTQKCNNTQSPGDGSCSIGGATNPNYVFASGNSPVQNNVTCVARYVSDPTTKKSINTTFKPIDFNVLLPGTMMATIGTPTEIKVEIRNSGLLTDGYNVSFDTNAGAYVYPSKVNTDTTYKNTSLAASSFLTILIAQNNVLRINVSSSTNSSILQQLTIPISSGSFALPDFHLLGLIQIMLLAVILLLIKFPRGRSSR
jgi:hypothetical protein